MPSVSGSKNLQETTFTLRNPSSTYLHLLITNHSKKNVSSQSATPIHLDEITLRTHLNSALNQYLGITGTAIPIDILKVEAANAWVRLPRDEESAVVAALSQWSGKDGTTIQVQGRSSWLGALASDLDERALWLVD